MIREARGYWIPEEEQEASVLISEHKKCFFNVEHPLRFFPKSYAVTPAAVLVLCNDLQIRSGHRIARFCVNVAFLRELDLQPSLNTAFPFWYENLDQRIQRSGVITAMTELSTQCRCKYRHLAHASIFHLHSWIHPVWLGEHGFPDDWLQ